MSDVWKWSWWIPIVMTFVSILWVGYSHFSADVTVDEEPIVASKLGAVDQELQFQVAAGALSNEEAVRISTSLDRRFEIAENLAQPDIIEQLHLNKQLRNDRTIVKLPAAMALAVLSYVLVSAIDRMRLRPT